MRWMGAWVLIAASAAGVAQPARAPTLQALRGVAPGSWSFRETGTTAPPRETCIPDTSAFLRLRLRTAECSRFVIANGPRLATVHYTCPGSGHVRTTIHADTPRVLRIESEGVIDGMPFADTLEARRVGVCGPRGR